MLGLTCGDRTSHVTDLAPTASILGSWTEGWLGRPLWSLHQHLMPPLAERLPVPWHNVCSYMKWQGLAVSHLPFSDITSVFRAPGCGLRCCLYTAPPPPPSEAAPVLPRHPQSLAAALRIPEDGLYPLLGPGVGVPVHTSSFQAHSLCQSLCKHEGFLLD